MSKCTRIGGCLHDIGMDKCCCDDNSCDIKEQPSLSRVWEVARELEPAFGNIKYSYEIRKSIARWHLSTITQLEREKQELESELKTYKGVFVQHRREISQQNERLVSLEKEKQELKEQVARIESETCSVCNYMRSRVACCKCGQYTRAGTNDQLRQQLLTLQSRCEMMGEALKKLANFKTKYPQWGFPDIEYCAQQALASTTTPLLDALKECVAALNKLNALYPISPHIEQLTRQALTIARSMLGEKNLGKDIT